MTKRKKSTKKPIRTSICLSLFLFAAALVLQISARRVPGFGQWYAVTVYPVLVRLVGGFFGLFPFSVVELGLYGLILGIIWYGVRCIRRPKDFCAALLLITAFLACSYTVNCGINYYRRPFSAYLDLEIRDSSEEELEALCELLVQQVISGAEELKQQAEGSLTCGSGGRTFISAAGFPRQARADMEKLGETYPQLSGYYPVPKPVMVSEILSCQSLSGVYSPFTIEANYNQDMTAYNIPHTACHELSHLKGFMREEEANFIGYLACIGSDCAYSRYSGYLSGFIYANNALHRQNPDRASKLYASLPESVREDLQANNTFWDRYEGRLSEAATQVNDTYLKANSQTEGVKSYGRVVDLLLAYYRREIKTRVEIKG